MPKKRRATVAQSQSFRSLALAEFQKMLGLPNIQSFSEARIKELLGDNPHLVDFQDFNEILAYLGQSRSTGAFFRRYFGTGFQTIDSLSEGVTRIRIHSFLFYGNFIQGFQELSKTQDPGTFERYPWDIEPVSERFTTDRIQPLSAEESHATGYLSGQENPLNNRQKAAAIRKAKHNAERYLAMNGVDIYLAGSMRSMRDFQVAANFVKGVRSQPSIRNLGLTLFNPLWAYMEDSQEKGLLEQLMLKKAQSMVYLAGDRDSFGKDSELATMLVQGKPVIVYVPRTPPPSSDKSSPEYQEWEKNEAGMDKRAESFSSTHPLRIQCDLNTGVGNGVVVCRDHGCCAQILYGLFTNTLEFDIDDSDPSNHYLRERLTGSAIRVITRNQFLTNSFWNQWHGN